MRRDKNKNRKYKDISYKKMYYFPFTPRLPRFYASKRTTEEKRWKSESKRDLDMISHPRMEKLGSFSIPFILTSHLKQGM